MEMIFLEKNYCNLKHKGFILSCEKVLNFLDKRETLTSKKLLINMNCMYKVDKIKILKLN